MLVFSKEEASERRDKVVVSPQRDTVEVKLRNGSLMRSRFNSPSYEARKFIGSKV
jgi:hypothetical protein